MVASGLTENEIHALQGSKLHILHIVWARSHHIHFLFFETKPVNEKRTICSCSHFYTEMDIVYADMHAVCVPRAAQLLYCLPFEYNHRTIPILILVLSPFFFLSYCY